MVISGALGTDERRRNPLLHHKVRDFDTPAAATLLGKSVFPELHPAFLGVHEGAMGLEHVRDYVAMSDCPILLGALITDLNLGIYTARLERRCAIYAAKDRVTDAFQMSGMKIATAARLGMNPIVVLLDNDGYGTERPLLDGAFNDLLRWRYADIPNILGCVSVSWSTEREMEDALAKAPANTLSWLMIHVVLDRDDHSRALRRLTAAPGERARSTAAASK